MESISFNPLIKNAQSSATPESYKDSSAKNEFATLFYKEILQQCFKDGFLGDGEGAYTQMAKDVFVEQMAKELASKNQALIQDYIR